MNGATRSGNSNDVSQGTADLQPILAAGYIEFDGATDGSGDFLIGSPIHSSDYTIFGVVRAYADSGNTWGTWLSNHADGSINPDFQMRAPPASDTLISSFFDTLNAAFQATATNAVRDADHIHAAYSYVAGGADGLVRVDGGTSEATIAASANPVGQAGINLYIGLQKPQSVANGRRFKGRIYEIIILDRRITEADFEFLQIEGYLAWKWGLEKSLPDGHPFAIPKGTVLVIQ